MPVYENLSPKIAEKVALRQANHYAFIDENAIRRDNEHDRPNVIRTPFIRDSDKILHCPFYSRYADKTQVFSFYKNDDISRRGLHVQLVSRIARTIGKALGLNLELIEAIALGHDIGHTPFGHAGETFLDEVYSEHTGRHFAHNIHSLRVNGHPVTLIDYWHPANQYPEIMNYYSLVSIYQRSLQANREAAWQTNN